MPREPLALRTIIRGFPATNPAPVPGTRSSPPIPGAGCAIRSQTLAGARAGTLPLGGRVLSADPGCAAVGTAHDRIPSPAAPAQRGLGLAVAGRRLAVDASRQPAAVAGSRLAVDGNRQPW